MQTTPILLMFLGHVWVDASQAILPVALVKLKDLFALSYFQVGLIMGVLNLTSSVIQPVFGYISDRFSTGWFVPAGILWTSFAMGLLGWSMGHQAPYDLTVAQVRQPIFVRLSDGRIQNRLLARSRACAKSPCFSA